jgi:hypothetical protein
VDRPVTAAKALLALRSKWNEKVQPPASGITVSVDPNGLCSTLATKGRYLLGAFRCKDRKVAETMTQTVLASLK